ncbi:hypothetical protein M409DRAFT_64365 [Zasmidium cellare ATCC 36951]|uniref:Uncharacterized protein n=1 Tax=Zasmidium cellare ATCC 36951 TaxID=1080233 RepID=A0A6A6CUT6_ZASCE|nr:uncharacterized protein M409DRAFT_64365 [Zasmidium cellare ATCC 36951]KAF2169958.1 hypothetical protein M409DRAFT_64365 [Zasmidium cellare ATCC 36951]
MHSPLPDSSALEAGILEDERPSRLSRVQDNVRNLLRTSVFGGVASVKSSPTTPTYPPPGQTHGLQHQPEVLPSPSPRLQTQQQAEVLPSPSSTHYTSSPLDTTFINPQGNAAPHIQSTHQSTLFNTRAVAALNHPDLSDPSLATFSQQKRQVRKQRSAASGWTRKGRSKRAVVAKKGSRGLLCLLAALLLAALVATYVTIATTASGLTTTFHVLFVLGICLATIVFAYSIIQLVFMSKRSRTQQPLFIAVSRHGNQRRHRHHHHHRHPPQQQQQRAMPTLTGESDFIPNMPIPVHLSSDDIRIHADPLPAQPTAGAEMASQEPWDKDAEELPNPPPAYGRWRNSVRANPDLLHWQAVPSPVTPETPALPSPTYEEAVREEGGAPPSYMTRESPARQREMREARAGIARSVVVEPEMVEARGQGVGVGLAM